MSELSHLSEVWLVLVGPRQEGQMVCLRSGLPTPYIRLTWVRYWKAWAPEAAQAWAPLMGQYPEGQTASALALVNAVPLSM